MPFCRFCISSGEKVIVIATGKVEAGVDLGDIEKDDVAVDGDSVTIDLPEPEILSVSLDEGRTRVYDRDFSPLNVRPDDDLVEMARLRAVEKIEDAAFQPSDRIGALEMQTLSVTDNRAFLRHHLDAVQKLGPGESPLAALVGKKD